jgi:hypothetical protein
VTAVAARAVAGTAMVATLALGGARDATAILAPLTLQDAQAAVDLGTQTMTQEDFGEEWHVTLPDGEELVVTTPFSRVAWAARQAALKGEPLTDKQRDEQIDRGKGRIQFLVTVYGTQIDFARWYQATLRVGDKEIKASFNQNERTALRLPDGRFAARNVYVFPLEGVPPRGTVTLVVRRVPEQKEILRAAVDLAKMR